MKRNHSILVRNFAIVLLVVVAAIASAGFGRPDQHWIPNIMAPASVTISPGQSATLTVSSAASISSDATVTVSMDSSLTGPSTITIPAGQTSGSFTVSANSGTSGAHAVTCSNAGHSVATNVTIQ